MDYDDIRKKYEEEQIEQEKRKSHAIRISLAVFVISVIVCLFIIKEQYSLTFTAIISISLALLTNECLSRKK